MTQTVVKAKLENMLNSKIQLSQVLSAFVVIIPMIVGVITFIDGRYETKANVEVLHQDRLRETSRLDKRIEKLEDSQAAMQNVQTQTYAEVKEISGYLRAKGERK